MTVHLIAIDKGEEAYIFFLAAQAQQLLLLLLFLMLAKPGEAA